VTAHNVCPADKTTERAAFARFFVDHFLAGYSRENVLADEWLHRLPLFCKYHQLLLFTVFYDGWTHPDAPQWQRRSIEEWRRCIVNEVPVIDPPL
jgi:Ser/Thr protein kinase RdoA (MazF antagonist)